MQKLQTYEKWYSFHYLHNDNYATNFAAPAGLGERIREGRKGQGREEKKERREENERKRREGNGREGKLKSGGSGESKILNI